MQIEHKNDLSSYLSNWLNFVRSSHLKPRDPKATKEGAPVVSNALFFHSNKINLILMLLEERLLRIESSWAQIRKPLTPSSFEKFDHRAYAEAGLFFESIFFYLKIYLDDIAGIIRHFYRDKNLPGNYSKLVKSIDRRSDFPDDLAMVIRPAKDWFSQLKVRRDDITHHFEGYILTVGNNTEYFSRKYENGVSEYFGEIRTYMGGVLRDCQILIDNLLDHFDDKFKEWYGIIGCLRHQSTIYIDSACQMLWWAYTYSNYRHKYMRIIE